MAADAKRLIDAASAVRERALLAKLARSAAELKAIHRELVIAEERLGALAELDVARRPLRPYLTEPARRMRGGLRTATAVAFGSDWHVEERVDPKTIDGLNSYNPGIATRRSERFFQGIDWLIREQAGMFQIADLNLIGGGDIITGYIHDELLEGNFMSPTEACLFAQLLWSNGIRFLLAETALNLNIDWHYGNHGRTTAKPRVATAAKNSFEWLLGHMLRKEFADEPRVQFNVADGAHVVRKIGEFRLHTHHGDTVKSNGGIGGIDVPLNRAVALWHQTMPADYTLVGHFHRFQLGRRLGTNGSLIGYSAFSRDRVKAPVEPPVQAFFLVDRLRGVTQCAPLWVQESSK